MDPPAKPSHHSAKVSSGSPGLPLRGDSVAWAPLSRAAVLVPAAVWMRVDGPHRSAAVRSAAHALLCAVLESDITCAQSTITSAAAPPALLQPPPLRPRSLRLRRSALMTPTRTAI